MSSHRPALGVYRHIRKDPDFSNVRQSPILVVDDSSDDRCLLFGCLRSCVPEHQPVILLNSGLKLLEYLLQLEMENSETQRDEAEMPDMIFLDLLMPEMDGIETLRAVREQSLWANVPVALTAGSRDSLSIRTAEKLGTNAILSKPFTSLNVMDALSRGHHFSPVIM